MSEIISPELRAIRSGIEVIDSVVNHWKDGIEMSDEESKANYDKYCFMKEQAALLAHRESDPGENSSGPFVRKSETSRQAAFDNLPRSGSQRRRVLESIRIAGLRGRTRSELEDELGLTGSSIHPRVLELIQGKWIEETSRKRMTNNGSKAAVLVATDKAHASWLR